MPELAFLISLPRSGSTLLQRNLAAHPNIQTSAEPWLLLPLLEWRKDLGQRALYNHSVMRAAINEFMDEERLQRFREMLRTSLPWIYDASGAPLFLDKTPRYSLILDELQATFEESKFIVLTRNPVSIINSMVDAWGDNGRNWVAPKYWIDLDQGLLNIVRFLQSRKANILKVRYEDYVSDPEALRTNIFRFLGVSQAVDLSEKKGHASTMGSMGDDIGLKKYKSISTESVNSSQHICNFMRRNWVKNYLRYIGSENIEEFGYDVDVVMESVERQTEQKYFMSDARDVFRRKWRRK